MLGVTRLPKFLGCPGEREAQLRAAPLIIYIPSLISRHSLLLIGHRLTMNNDIRVQQTAWKVGPLSLGLSVQLFRVER